MPKQLARITRAQVKPTTMALLAKQKWICPLCGTKIRHDIVGHKSDYVLDHCHETGEVRGALHRSCNSGEGKVANAVGRWIAGKVQYDHIIPALERLLAYYRGSGTGLMYPDHKTPEQQHVINLKKRREASAKRKATAAMKAKGVTK